MNGHRIVKRVSCLVLAFLLIVSAIGFSKLQESKAAGIELGLTLRQVNKDGHWWFNKTTDEFKQGFYRMNTRIDGVDHEVVIESDSAGNIYIYNNFFTALPGDELTNKIPTTSFSILAGTTLSQVDVNNGWQIIEGGQTYTIKDTVNLVPVEMTAGTAWIDAAYYEEVKDLEPYGIKVELNAVNGNTILLKTTTQDDIALMDVYGDWKLANGFVKYGNKVGNDYVMNSEYISYSTAGDGEAEGGKSALNLYTLVLDGIDAVQIDAGTILYPSSDCKVKTPIEIKNNFRIIRNGSVWEVDTTFTTDYDFGEIEEKESKELQLSYREIINEAAAFNGMVAGNEPAVAGWYKTQATIDGNDTEVIFEYFESESTWYIYSNCFSSIPNENVMYPTESFVIQKDAVLTPVTLGTWADDPNGQPYTLKEKVDIVVVEDNVGSIWMDTGYYEEVKNQTPYEIAIGFDKVEVIETADGSSTVVYLSLKTEDGAYLTDIYGGWKFVRGFVQSGVKNGHEFDLNAAYVPYSTADGNSINLYTVNLTGLNVMQIDAGTVLYPDTDCLSIRPIEIKNNLRIVYTDDGWKVDESFTTDYDFTNTSAQQLKAKKDLNLKFSQKLSSNAFSFKGSVSNGVQEAGWYKTEATIDGKNTEVIFEYFAQDNIWYIYDNCFTSFPNVDSKVPKKSFVIKKGAVLTPLNVGTWTVNYNGQPYKIVEKVDIIAVKEKMGDIWMDADYKAKTDAKKPLEVKINSFVVQGRVLKMNITTSKGKSIMDIYGDWTHANGFVLADKDAMFTAYTITGDQLQLYGIQLSALDAVQIEAGTVLYPDSACKSLNPIKIVNNFRIARNADDEWELDTKFSTDYKKEPVTDALPGDNSGEQSQDNGGDATVTEDISGQETTISVDEKDYRMSNITHYKIEPREKESVYVVANSNLWIYIVSGAAFLGILVALGLLLKSKKK